MHAIQNSVRGLHLLFDLNIDRLLFPGAISLALVLAAYLVSL
ncbi:hypothetical protein [Rhodovulum adriaticum]|uniref:Uncharacterized protein n=1 Tax=Rhodovulum adriaticum TaxID=35804 RepID=A0A4R2NTD4_RHOAD|nr:hypothetical protein [Rhodovulum adriaticum]TCP25289.1 hypothetical protein EV656_10338 [Rhodovulum adriaticum]